MGQTILRSLVWVLVVAGAALAGGRGASTFTGKYQSYKDGVLKIKDLRSGDREFKLATDTSVVSMSNTNQKLPLATAFDGVEPGRIVRVYVKGAGDNAKVVAVQIGVGASGTAKRPAPMAEDLTKAKPAYVVSAEALFQEFKEDKKAAEAKYQNQVVEVSGVVAGVGQHVLSRQQFVDLAVPKQFSGVMCFTADKEPWAKVAPGQKVTLKGKWPKGAFSAQLVNCVFTERGPSPALRIAAQTLVKEYLAGKEATRQKYHNKWLIVDGLVGDIDLKKKIVTLKGDGKARVTANFAGGETSPYKPVKAGQQLTLLGRATIYASGEDGLYLDLALPITKKR